ncbi:MAG: PorP/SprF family type IX secretion system membrane protein [Flavobacteriales bacterium]|nr:PorP/SprF family type IX secretion system membrane protein [Flavobacteriales bacterium]
MLSLSSIFLFLTSQSQDIHLSQFNSSPMNLNPALVGGFDGQYRFIGNQRRQWVSISPDAVPYQTIGLSADANSFIKHGVGAGVSVYNDRDGWSKLNTLQVNLAGSYQFKINSDSTLLIAPGIQVGITQQNINYDDLTFDNQYNGNYYDAGLGFGENFSKTSHLYANVNAGVAVIYKISDRKTIDAGISLYNLTQPKQSFQGDNNIRLDRRFNFHARVTIPIAEQFDLIPSYLFMSQGKFREFDIGASLKYTMSKNEFSYQAIYFGLWGRTKDAGFVSVGMDYNAWHIGVSYDINLSTLRPASNGRGGLELAVIYIIQPKPPKRLKYKMCPNYI